MKSLRRTLLLVLAFTIGVWAPVQAQSFKQLESEYDKGNFETAFAGFGKLAEQGVAEAQYKLALMYGNGYGGPKDVQQYVVWIRRAADQGHARAAMSLGSSYASGYGVTKDDRQAALWYRKAAEYGDDMAQLTLGATYFLGRELPKDDQQATVWYRRAAEQGNLMAQTGLAMFYANGIGVAKDEQSAYFWLLLASAQGSQSAALSRDQLEPSLSPEQRAAAQLAARTWRPKTAAQSISPSGGGSTDSSGSNAAPSRPTSATVQADSTGSGFRVARGAIVTNHHVVDGCRRLRVNGIAAQVRGIDPRSDLALLGATLPGTTRATLRAQRASVGEMVSVAGFPLSGLLSGFNMTTGNLSSMSGMGGDTRLVQITAPVQPGNSGGPMLDSAGNLMGVVVSKLDAIKAAKLIGDIPQNINFAINANVLRSFLDANGVDYDTASSDKPIATTAIAEKAKGFTVLVECWR